MQLCTMSYAPTDPDRADHLAVLRAIEDRVLWLSTAIVDHANRVRPNPEGMKVGGHQASSASMVSIMTALWFHALTRDDRVSVKPHASPALHAIEYLMGQLHSSDLESLRAFGGLQPYPSRTKDPVPADYSTGSVGIGATAPLWGAIARRYVDAQFESAGVGRGRQYSLLGDAELDEGACWEAVLDPMIAELGEVVWIVDFNRQSLDRIVPAITAGRIEGMFAAAGWQVLTVKYGEQLSELFSRPGGEALRERLDAMTNAEYQRLLRHAPDRLRALLPGDGQGAAAISALIDPLSDEALQSALRNLGGHDLGALLDAFSHIDDDRPTVVIAYTIKGYGLASQAHPQNHSSLLTEAQLTDLAVRLGTKVDRPWARFEVGSDAERHCRTVAERLRRPQLQPRTPPSVPADLGRTPQGTGTTQAALGRALMDLTRAAPDVGRRIVTVSPDVSSSTNLGGWVNKVGVWSHEERSDWFSDDAETILHWREKPSGQHVELGIAEVNLVGLLGELGATWSRWEQPVFPIGVLYDPFVGRALEPWSFGMYAGGQSILVGTPSGVTLAAEGGAHQSITTPSIGLEQPGCVTYEPAFAIEAEWCLLSSLGRLGRPGGGSAYLRLSTRPVDQSLAGVPTDPAARERRRRQVVAGGYRLRATPEPAVTIVAVGAMLTEAVAAADRLEDLGVAADVVNLTSPDLVFRAMQSRRGRDTAPSWILDAVLPAERATPLVTVLDGHPHTLSFLAGVHGVRSVHLGVTEFGQGGDLRSVYRHHGIDADSLVAAALDLVG
jgi:pyruvate dehydrogenase E1 component